MKVTERGTFLKTKGDPCLAIGTINFAFLGAFAQGVDLTREFVHVQEW